MARECFSCGGGVCSILTMLVVCIVVMLVFISCSVMVSRCVDVCC